MDTRREPVIVSAVRTPIGRFLGGLVPAAGPHTRRPRHQGGLRAQSGSTPR